jgi:Undecaprenyl-phosphate galactose phosphotransferase WbaP
LNLLELALSQLEPASALSLSNGASDHGAPPSDFSLDEKIRKVTTHEIVLKRVFDLISVAVIFALFWWAMLLIMIAVKLSSPGPVVFGHLRVGRLGKSFRCYKFRSMVPNAEEVLNELLDRDPEARAEWDRDFKLKNDPRITKIGVFIRKTSLDELPQLWNVLRGDMSIVGPRPVVRKELAMYYSNGRRHYLSMRPGLTGLWQVSGRNNMDYEERVELDKQYVQTWNVFRDFMIVMRTVGVMFGKNGAY